jgi:hypothetical protein
MVNPENMQGGSRFSRLGDALLRFILGPEDIVDRSVEPPLTEGPQGYRGRATDEELRAALSIRPRLREQLRKELKDPTPPQVLADEEAQQILGPDHWAFDTSVPGATAVTSPDGRVRSWVRRPGPTEEAQS